MANETMMLVERLRNPQYIIGEISGIAFLDTNFTLKTMIEAANRIEELENEVKQMGIWIENDYLKDA